MAGLATVSLVATQYGHMIAEVLFTTSGGSATLIDTDRLSVDGVLHVRAYRDPGDVADTLNEDTYVDFVDVHYQSTNMATKDKNTPFYT